MKKKKILIIYGFGQDPDFEIHKMIKKIVGNKGVVFCDYYAQYRPKDALIDLNNMVKDNKIDIVIGFDIGAWLSLYLNNKKVNKIFVNPIYDPIETWSNETDFPEYILNFYKEFIDNTDKQEYDGKYIIESHEINYDILSEICDKFIFK